MTQPNQQDRGDLPQNSRSDAAPTVDLTHEEEAQANDLPDQASYQASPVTDDPARARAREAPTAARAEEAAGLDAHNRHLADSERAFTESRGSHAPRTPGYLRDRE